MSASTLQEVRYRAHIHHPDHAALLAVCSHDGQGVGVARYIRHPHDREAAEVAVAVVDEWQGAGLGTELLSRLAEHARGQGIERFTAVLPADDLRARRLLTSVARVVTLVRADADNHAYEVALLPSHLAAKIA
jgi:protein lysine acetyltransferase